MGNFRSQRIICLLDKNAHCNPIWVSQPNGLHLAHFQTFQREWAQKEHAPIDAAYEKCVFGLVPIFETNG